MKSEQRPFFQSNVIGSIGGILIVGSVGLMDSFTMINLAPIYVFAIALVSWFVGLRAGVMIAVTTTLMALFPNEARFGGSEPLSIRAGNALIRLLVYPGMAVVFYRLRQSNWKDQMHARRDALTGLFSRRYFLEFMEHEIKRATRYRRPFTVGYIDIDDFKTINDCQGHVVGDKVLAKVGHIMAESVRESDVVARLGGDEFALFFPETGGEAARIIIENLRSKLADQMKQEHWPITFSIGVVTFVEPPVSSDEIIKLADEAMYRVKNSTKDSSEYEIRMTALGEMTR